MKVSIANNPLPRGVGTNKASKALFRLRPFFPEVGARVNGDEYEFNGSCLVSLSNGRVTKIKVKVRNQR